MRRPRRQRQPRKVDDSTRLSLWTDRRLYNYPATTGHFVPAVLERNDGSTQLGSVSEWFPIMGSGESIPFAFIARHRLQAKRNHDQTLERLAERGGLDWAEALAVCMDRNYFDVFGQGALSEGIVAEAKKDLLEAIAVWRYGKT